jgi:Carbohydrate family 9 binding domain-like
MLTRRQVLQCAGLSLLITRNRSLGQQPSVRPSHIEQFALLQYTSHSQITARSLPREFTVDGNLDDRIWGRAEWISFDNSASGRTQYPDLLTRAAILWTNRSLYVAFQSHYHDLNVYQAEDPAIERWGLWKRDVVELFLNPFPVDINHYYEFEVSPNNQWVDLQIDRTKSPPSHDASWNSGFRHATKVHSTRHLWACEMCIPVRSMNVLPPRPGMEWRLNLFRSDGLNGTRRLLAWSSILEGDTFHVPARFGILRFEN